MQASDSSLKDKCHLIKVVITDVDGVLTDGGMYYSENGEEMKKFNVRDGVGVALLKLAGLTVGVITGEAQRLTENRMRKIGMDFIISGAIDKKKALENIISTNGWHQDTIAYVGDEINDFLLLGRVGLFICVADAHSELRNHADYVLQSRGGEGTLREVADFILKNCDSYIQTSSVYHDFCTQLTHEPTEKITFFSSRWSLEQNA